jgi:hypothetical protein
MHGAADKKENVSSFNPGHHLLALLYARHSQDTYQRMVVSMRDAQGRYRALQVLDGLIGTLQMVLKL